MSALLCLTCSFLFTNCRLSLIYLQTYQAWLEGDGWVADGELFIVYFFSLCSWWVVNCSWQSATCSLNMKSLMKSLSICCADMKKRTKELHYFTYTSTPNLNLTRTEQHLCSVTTENASDPRNWEPVPKSELPLK